MGKEIKAITAKEARALAESSNFTLKHIYKVIRERADENATSTEWCTYDLAEVALKLVEDQLKNDGFVITVDKENYRLIIKW